MFALVCLVACGADPSERLARGEAALADGEYSAAAIDARNVLQSEPDNVAARLLLGRASLALGDIDSADKELRRAIDLGVDKATVFAEWGRLLMAKQEFQQVLDDIPVTLIDEGAEPALVQRLRGDALLGLGRAGEARELYQQILANDEANVGVMLAVVSTYVQEGRFDQAEATLEQVRSADPAYVPSWLMTARLHMISGQAADAEAALKTSLELSQKSGDKQDEASALRGLIEAQLSQNKVDEAKAYSARLVELAPKDVTTRFVQGRLAFADGDWQAAQQHLQEVLKIRPDYVPAKTMLGAVHLGRGNLGQADMYLSAVVAAEPENTNARRLLAETRLQQNNSSAASLVLQPLIESNDARSLGLAARASIASGDIGAAEEYLQKRIDADPDNAELYLDLAAARIASGDVVGAEAILNDVQVSSDSENYRRELLIVMSHMSSGDFAAAVRTANAMIDKLPEDARLYNLLGGIYLGASENEKARAAFSQALRLAPADKPAIINLARVDVAEGDFQSASRRFEELLKANPADTESMLALASLAAQQNKRAEILQWLERAHSTNTGNATVNLMLGRYHLAAGDLDAAERYAEQAKNINPQSAEAHALMGMVQSAQNKMQAAVTSLRRAVELQPGNAAYTLAYARSLAAAGDVKAANEALDSMQSSGQGDLQTGAQIAVARLQIGNIAGAVDAARQLSSAYPDSEVPLALLGEAYFADGKAVEGAAEFDRALGKRMSLQLALRAFQLRQSNGIPNPESPVSTFLAENPDNANARLVLAQYWQSNGDRARAIAAYEKLLEADPTNFTVLNNLAWEYFTANDERAEDLARRAHAQQPDNASVADTLGWILIKKGTLQEGVQLLREAAKMNTTNPNIQYHLAVGLAESGHADEARDMLEKLLAMDASFSERDAATAFLQTL